MTEQSNADLIGEATRAAQAVYLATDERLADDLSRIIHTLAERLEAADQRAAELAAVVEKVLNHDPLHGADSGPHCGGMAPCIRNVLATAPADVLREHDALVWDEGAGDMAEHIDNGAWWEIQNPYRQAKRVLMTHPHDGHDLGDMCLDCQRREEQDHG